MHAFRGPRSLLSISALLLIAGWFPPAQASREAAPQQPSVQQPAVPPAATKPPPTLVSAEEELLAEKDAATPVFDDEDTVSADGRRVAWRARRGNTWVVVTNGQAESLAFDEVRWITFSPDSRRLAYRGKRADKWVTVLDGQAYPTQYDEIRNSRFSPDGKHLAFPAKKDRQWRMVVDGAEQGAQYEDMGEPGFSRDGAHMGFGARKGKKWVLVTDGKESPEHDGLASFLFSPDSQRLAFVASDKRKLFVVLDGKEGPPFDVIGGVGFSRDSKRFAYSGVQLDHNKGNGQVLVDGEEGPRFQGGSPSSLGKSILTGTTTSLLPGLFPSLWPEWHGVSGPRLSPDGRHVAYVACRGKKDMVAMIDGQAGASVEMILQGPAFSEDSQHTAYVAKDKDTLATVVDGKRTGEFPAGGVDMAGELTLSPDGRRVAMVGVWGGTWFDHGLSRRARRRVFLDGQPGPEYNAIALRFLMFGPDGRHFAYEAHDIGDGVSLVVADTAEGKRYDRIWFGSLAFTSENSISYIARAGRRFYRVQQKLGS